MTRKISSFDYLGRYHRGFVLQVAFLFFLLGVATLGWAQTPPSVVVSGETDTPIPQKKTTLTEWKEISVFEIRDRLQQISQSPASQTTPEDLRWMWTAFWYSRLGIIAEDPDIFERALDSILQVYTTDTQNSIIEDVVPYLIVESSVLSLQEHWSARYPNMAWTIPNKIVENIAQTIRAQIQTEKLPDATYTDWIEALQSTGGSIGVEYHKLALKHLLPGLCTEKHTQHICTEIHETWNLDSPLQLSPPQWKPGQVQGQPIPERPAVEITEFSSPFLPEKGVFIGLILVCIGILIHKKYWKMASVCSAVSVLWIVDVVLQNIVPPLIRERPLFATHQWQIVPWEEGGDVYTTQGSYIRAQHIQKTPTLPRIVILGASSAHGSNELWENSFAGRLEATEKFDVVNLAIGGTTSNGILHLVPYTLDLQPDLVILYYGHNEIAQFQQVLSYVPDNWQESLWLQQILWNSSLYSLLYRTIDNNDNEPMENTHPLHSSLSINDIQTIALRNFRWNITSVLETYQAHDIPVLLLNPPTNYPFAPHSETDHKPETIEEYQNLIDSCMEATTIHSSIRAENLRLAQTYATGYLDLDAYFHAHSPDGTSANGLFWDELHPSTLGHEWIYLAIEPWIAQTLQQQSETP